VVQKVKKGAQRVGKFAKDYAPLAGLMLMNAGVGYAATKGMEKAARAYENRQRQAEIRRANERDIRLTLKNMRATHRAKRRRRR